MLGLLDPCGDPVAVPGFDLAQPKTVVAIWELKQWMEDLSLSFTHSFSLLTLSFKQTNKSYKKKFLNFYQKTYPKVRHYDSSHFGCSLDLHILDYYQSYLILPMCYLF